MTPVPTSIACSPPPTPLSLALPSNNLNVILFRNRILGLEGTPEGVENNGSVTRVATFPIGIDPERFTRALDTDEVQSNIAKLLNRYAGRKIMLGVDRLDMVKGIPQKLLAYEKFLEEHPEWRDKVLLVQIAVPSRTDVPEYQKLRRVHLSPSLSPLSLFSQPPPTALSLP